jgi:hypothetical protein
MEQQLAAEKQTRNSFCYYRHDNNITSITTSYYMSDVFLSVLLSFLFLFLVLLFLLLYNYTTYYDDV